VAAAAKIARSGIKVAQERVPLFSRRLLPLRPATARAPTLIIERENGTFNFPTRRFPREIYHRLSCFEKVDATKHDLHLRRRRRRRRRHFQLKRKPSRARTIYAMHAVTIRKYPLTWRF